MALRDHYDEADVLASFSWVAMTEKARVAGLAKLYLDEEVKIESRSRSYNCPTKGTVGLFIRSLYAPPRGTIGPTTDAVLVEIQKQRLVRLERKKNRPWVAPTPFSEHQGYARKDALKKRMNRLAKRRYRTCSRHYKAAAPSYSDPAVVGITTVADCLLIVDDAAYNTQPRVYLKHKPTGKEKLVVLDGQPVGEITNALLRMAPERALRGMFGGKPITLDFEGEGFLVDGETYPWRNVLKVYRGRKAMRKTAANPSRS